MASIAGGRADKQGNEFERLWTVRHLIDVLAGKSLSIEIESFGDDERGTEFWVSRADGTREAHQCKRENRSLGKWTIHDLASKGILKNATFQLDRDPSHHFYFVSGDEVRFLPDMEERASGGAVGDDLQLDLFSTSTELEREFIKLCDLLKCDRTTKSGRSTLRDFLRRFHARSIGKLSIRSEVEDIASRWVKGDPKIVVAVLETFVSTKEAWGRRLRDSDVAAALPPGTKPHDLAKDLALPARIREQNDRFESSYRYLLISGKTLDRPETDELWNLLVGQGKQQVFLLDGAGGCGKSGVVFELVTRLREGRIPVLATRLDLKQACSPATVRRPQ